MSDHPSISSCFAFTSALFVRCNKGNWLVQCLYQSQYKSNPLKFPLWALNLFNSAVSSFISLNTKAFRAIFNKKCIHQHTQKHRQTSPLAGIIDDGQENNHLFLTNSKVKRLFYGENQITQRRSKSLKRHVSAHFPFHYPILDWFQWEG